MEWGANSLANKRNRTIIITAWGVVLQVQNHKEDWLSSLFVIYTHAKSLPKCGTVWNTEKKIIKKKHTTLTPTVALLATVALVNYFIGFCSTLQKWTGKGISTCVAWVLFLGHSWCRAGYSTMTTRQLYSGVVGDRVGNHITPSLIPSSPLPSPPLEVCWWLWLWSLQESSLCHKRPKFINFHLHQ